MSNMHPNRVVKRALALLLSVIILFSVFLVSNGSVFQPSPAAETKVVSVQSP